MAIILYGCESWVISHDMESKINAFANCDFLLQDYALHKTKISCPKHHDIFHDKHWASYPPCSKSPVEVPFGHILCLPEEEEPANRYALYIPPHGNRRPGRPRTSSLAYIQQLLGQEEGSIQADQTATLAKDQNARRSLVVAFSVTVAEGWWWLPRQSWYP